MTLLFTGIFVVMLLFWLDWIWWKMLFGHQVDNFFLLLAMLAGGMARVMFVEAGSMWQAVLGVGFALLSVVAIVVGIGRKVNRRT